jgi:recombinational DNA repair protein RecT
MSEEKKNAVVKADAAAGNVAVPKKGAARPEVGILKRLNNKDAADSLYNVILQLTGGDKLFVEKFVMCCKAQIEKHWKKNEKGEWTNPFLLIPINSQLDALYKCASRKILPDGYNCNLIPYIGREEKRVDVSIDFKGLVDIAIREEIILDCDAKEVCENDDFEWSMGEIKRWSIDFRKPRGAPFGYCAWAVLPDGKKKWSFMSMEEIAAVRKCARTQKIWDKWEGEMSKKTVIRRLFKTLRNTPKLINLMELDNEAYDMEIGNDGVYRQSRRHAAPVRQLTDTAKPALPSPEEVEPEAETQESTPEREAIPVEAVRESSSVF